MSVPVRADLKAKRSRCSGLRKHPKMKRFSNNWLKFINDAKHSDDDLLFRPVGEIESPNSISNLPSI